ncbi:WbqC family protein [Streptomyces sp. NPDC059695]|uniref:WbqC family protein n=1 Tax=Streptomyces sp. NPDC059695 TaxID=3346910 RepID=UPI0036C3AEDA
MPRTKTSSAPASPAGSSAREAAPGGLVAIHQPNLFPRLSTLAKLFAADCWIVLDDVQFARRDFQHRARLAAMSGSARHQWLSLPTHLPHGRSTLIRDAVLTDHERSRQRVATMLPQYYAASPDWALLRPELDSVLAHFHERAGIADVAEESTKALLRLLGWTGHIVRSSSLPARPGRSQRLADLAAAVGASGYLCGTGGMRYLEVKPFAEQGVIVVPFRSPLAGVWEGAREVSAMSPLMGHGISVVVDQVRDVTDVHRGCASST